MASSGHRGGALRLFDGMSYALAGVLFILLVPSVGRTPFGDLSTLSVIPVAALAIAMFCLLRGTTVQPRALPLLLRLRLSALFMLGLSPFVSWWLRFADNVYFACMGGAGIMCFLWCQLEMVSLIESAARQLQKNPFADCARTVRYSLVFLSLVPIISYYVASLVLLYIDGSMTVADLSTWWLFTVPTAARVAPFLPLFAACALYLSTGTVLGQQFADVYVAPYSPFSAEADGDMHHQEIN